MRFNTLNLCNQRSQFGGHSHCGSREKTFMICHVISKHHVLKGLRDFKDGSSAQQVTTLPGLTVSSHCGSGDITYSICNVTLQEHVIKGSCDFTVVSSSLYVTTLPCLVPMSIVVVEMFLIYDVTSPDHLFKGLCDFMVENFSQ